MPPPLLDTSVLLRHLTGDHPDHSPRATAFLAMVSGEQLAVRITDQVIFEATFTLERSYKVPKSDIRDALLGFIALPSVLLAGKQFWRSVFDMYVDSPLSIVDAFHAVTMKRLRITEIVSFDRDFDHIPGITRIQP